MWCVPSSTYHSTLHLLGQQERASFLRASVNSKCPVWKRARVGVWENGAKEGQSGVGIFNNWNYFEIRLCLLSLARKNQSISIGMYRCIEPVNRYYCNMVSYPTQSIEHRTSSMVLYHTVITILASCHVMSPKAWSEEDQSASSLISSWYEYPIAMILWVESSLVESSLDLWF